MITTCAHTKARSSTSVAPARRRTGRTAPLETGDQPAGHSSRPSAMREACHRSSVDAIPAIRPRIRSASPMWLPVEAPRPLHLADPEGGRHAAQHEHGEHVDEQREPALVPEPRQCRLAVDHPDHRHEDGREAERGSPRRSARASVQGRNAGGACAGPTRSRPRCGGGAGGSRCDRWARPSGRGGRGRVPGAGRACPPRQRGHREPVRRSHRRPRDHVP